MIEGTPSIGAELKARREGRGLTIGHASKQTHIKARYIQAIEAMQPDALPSLGYVLGFVRTYAGYLDMDGEIAVKRYKEDVAAPKLLGWRERAILIPRREIKLPRGLISAMSVMLCAICVAMWFQNQRIVTDTAPDALKFANQQNITAVSGHQNAGLDMIEIPLVLPNVLTVKAIGPSWVQVKDPSGKVLISRIMVTGETWKTDKSANVTLSARDGGALELYRGEELIGPLGPRWQSIADVSLAETAEPPIGVALIETFHSTQ